MVRVNITDLDVLSHYGMLSDDVNVELFGKTNPEDRCQVMSAFRTWILPEILREDRRRAGSLQRLKNSLRFFLNKPDFKAYELYQRSEPAFPPPSDPIQYYIWCWEELFPAENYHLDCLRGYEEDPKHDLAPWGSVSESLPPPKAGIVKLAAWLKGKLKQ